MKFCKHCKTELDSRDCTRCDGLGGWERYNDATDDATWIDCDDCDGTGAVERCPRCLPAPPDFVTRD